MDGKTVYTKRKDVDQDPEQSGFSSGVLYDMTGFIGQCVELYLELSGVQRHELSRRAQVPWLPEK